MTLLEVWNYTVLGAGFSATALLIVSYIPQIWSLFNTKNAEGISLSFWLILDASLLCLFILAFNGYLETGAVGLAIAQALNLAFALIVTVQVLIYRKK